MAFDLTALLSFAKDQDASDLHISAGMPPLVRIRGEMIRLEMPALSREETQASIYDVLNDTQKRIFEERRDLDFAFEIPGVSRFRVNYYRDRHGPGGVFRAIPYEIMTAAQLGLPKGVLDLCFLTKGLVLVTGPTGSGKSTTRRWWTTSTRTTAATSSPSRTRSSSSTSRSAAW